MSITYSEEMEDRRRLETVWTLPLEHPKLRSLSEVSQARTCPGWDSEGCIARGNELDEGDELEPGEELCPADRRAEAAHYERLQREREQEEEILNRSQYYHLKGRA